MLPTTARYGEVAEEWAIHDYDGFGELRLDENEALSTIARVAGGIREHGDAFLGSLLKQKRKALGLSLRQLAKLADVNDVNIFRLERGDCAAPAPDKLARIAEALGLSLADVYALADYAVPTDLPSFKPYLKTKYRGLPRTRSTRSRPTPRSWPRSTE